MVGASAAAYRRSRRCLRAVRRRAIRDMLCLCTGRFFSVTGGLLEDAVVGNFDVDRRREAELESYRRYVVGLECWSVRVELLVAVIRPHRVVIRVGIVFKRRVADAEASANYSLFAGTIGHPEARRKVAIPGLQSKIGRIRTYPGDDQGISRRIIVGKASGALGGCRRIKSGCCSTGWM